MMSSARSRSRLSLLFPIGVLLAGARTKCWVRAHRGPDDAPPRLRVEWRASSTHDRDRHDLTGPVLGSFSEPGEDTEVLLDAPAAEGEYVLELFDDSHARSSFDPLLIVPVTVIDPARKQAHLLHDVRPLSFAWGVDRGVPTHRLHVEQFLEANGRDIQGRCLEFQESRYVPRFGGPQVTSIDVLHVDGTNPRATVIGDLTQPNDLPGSAFDCIVCTHVLQSIFDLPRAIAELHRLLAPGGVLLVAEPHLGMCDVRYDELWRFTVDGLRRLLTTVFAPANVEVRSFGNSLTAAGELRGMVAADFSPDVLAHHDQRFGAEICARAVR